MDDASLVAAAVAGDKDAFAAIYDRYAVRIHDFVYSVLRNREDAADVLHDAFITAGARLHQLRDPAKLRPWLYAIARHRALRVAQQRSRQDPLGDVEVKATDPGPEEVAGQRDVVELVWSAAEGLSPRDRVVLDLHLRQGLEGAELGDALGVSADHAYVMMSRLRDQVERSLGALLVARQGRADCQELAEVLQDWDGRFTALWRKRVGRHVDQCDVCATARQRLASPLALLSSTPAFALPAGLRDRVLDEVRVASHRGMPWPASNGGFPPPIVRERRRGWPGAAVAACILLFIGAAAGLDRTADDPVSPITATSPSTTGGATHADSSVAGQSSVASQSSVVAPSSTTSAGLTVTTRATGTNPPPAPTVVPPATRSPIVTSTTVTTPVVARDTEPPVLGSLEVSPSTLRPSNSCSNRGDPEQATVTVVVSDRSGISSVTLNPGGRGMVLVRAGTYRAVVGPFGPVAQGSSTRVPLTVTAIDGAGNTASATTYVIVKCDPFPQ